jgi:hypothetical protein
MVRDREAKPQYEIEPPFRASLVAQVRSDPRWFSIVILDHEKPLLQERCRYNILESVYPEKKDKKMCLGLKIKTKKRKCAGDS